jgi:hypothetical protein
VSIVFGLRLQLPDVVPGFKFWTGFGLKVTEGEESESSSSSEDEEGRKSSGFKLPKINIKVPSLSFGSSWSRALYGGEGASGSVVLPKGQVATLTPQFLGVGFALSHTGDIEFNAAGKWKLNLAPLGFLFPDAELHKAGHFAALRSPDAEIGFSFDKNSAKHFFTFTKPLLAPKFSLKVQVCIDKQVDKEIVFTLFLILVHWAILCTT